MRGEGENGNISIRLTHLLLQKLDRAPSRHVLHIMPVWLQNKGVCMCVGNIPPGVGIKRADLRSYLLLRTVCALCAFTTPRSGAPTVLMERPPQRSFYGAHCQRVTRQPLGYASAINPTILPKKKKKNPDRFPIQKPLTNYINLVSTNPSCSEHR